jgi:hypothetical protein
MLAIRARATPDILLRVGALVARRGASLRSALAVRDPGGERCALSIIVAGPSSTLARLPFWIAALADVVDVQDLLSPGASAAEASTPTGPEESW